MEYDEHSTQVVNFVTGLALGAVLGAGIALLTAPQSGRRTRRHIRRAAVDVRSQAGDRWEDLAEDVKNRVDDALSGARARIKR
jgi:gas vesicle protein